MKIEKLIQRKRQKAILFADISGSSALYKKVGNIKAKKIVDSLLELLHHLISNSKGRVIKNIGDEVMACFDDCNCTLLTAVALQKNFDRAAQKYHLQLSIGMGFGEVLEDHGDIFGDAVNDAAFVTKIASGGQILLTEGVWQNLETSNRAMIREFDQIKFKGAARVSAVFRMYWQEQESRQSETRLMPGKVVEDPTTPNRITIKYRDKELAISQSQTPFIIGRDQDKCDLMVFGSQVSREHCKIDFSRGKFVLIDHSTNGCFLEPRDKEAFYIRREAYPLIEYAKLSLGIPIDQAEEEAIELYY